MGSRVRQNPEKLFIIFAEIFKPQSGIPARWQEDTWKDFVLHWFPQDSSIELLRRIPEFAFPCEVGVTSNSSIVGAEHYCFTFTDEEGLFLYGFCRRNGTGDSVLVILSHLPWFEFFYKLLNTISDVLSDGSSVEPLLTVLTDWKLRPAGTACTFEAACLKQAFEFTVPDTTKLPSIPESRTFCELYSALDTNLMMALFASLLLERRILMVSRRLSRLTSCVHAAVSLLYPMHWQHIFIPVLPAHIIDTCTAPMPYLIGIPSSLMEKVNRAELEEVVIVNIDERQIETPINDLQTLPSEVVSKMKKQLNEFRTNLDKATFQIGDSIAIVFLKAMVTLIGGYRDAVRRREGEQIVFDSDLFVSQASSSLQPFLKTMLTLQIFEEFIKERVEMMNSGKGYSTDRFEEQVSIAQDEQASHSKYNQLASTVKKHGKKLQSHSKEAWSEFKSKGKTALKGIQHKLEDKPKKEAIINRAHSANERTRNSVDLFKRPLSVDTKQLTSTSPRPQRPPRPPAPRLGNRPRNPGSPEVRKYDLLNLDEAVSSHSSSDLRPLPEDRTTGLRRSNSDTGDLCHVDLDLSNDPAILNTIQKTYSMDDLDDGESSTDEEQDDPERYEAALISLDDSHVSSDVTSGTTARQSANLQLLADLELNDITPTASQISCERSTPVTSHSLLTSTFSAPPTSPPPPLPPRAHAHARESSAPLARPDPPLTPSNTPLSPSSAPLARPENTLMRTEAFRDGSKPDVKVKPDRPVSKSPVSPTTHENTDKSAADLLLDWTHTVHSAANSTVPASGIQHRVPTPRTAFSNHPPTTIFSNPLPRADFSNHPPTTIFSNHPPRADFSNHPPTTGFSNPSYNMVTPNSAVMLNSQTANTNQTSQTGSLFSSLDLTKNSRPASYANPTSLNTQHGASRAAVSPNIPLGSNIPLGAIRMMNPSVAHTVRPSAINRPGTSYNPSSRSPFSSSAGQSNSSGAQAAPSSDGPDPFADLLDLKSHVK